LAGQRLRRKQFADQIRHASNMTGAWDTPMT
jgi:hypothetical protein